MVSAGLTHIDKHLPLLPLQWLLVVISVVMNLAAAMLGAGFGWHLVSALLGFTIAARPTSTDERLLLQESKHLQGRSWSQFLDIAPLVHYLDNQSPFWSWLVVNMQRKSRIFTTGLSCVAVLMLFQQSPVLSFLLAGTPLFILLRSGMSHDIVAFDLAVIGVLSGSAVGGVLVGISICTKYYFLPTLLLFLLKGDLVGWVVSLAIIGIYLEWLQKTRLWRVQNRFLKKTLTGGCRATLLTTRRHLTWRNSSRRAGLFALYLLPLWITVNPLFVIGFGCALYMLAQPKYLLLLIVALI